MAKKVYIDPGHGGTDPGAVDGKANDPLYTREKEINLDIANKLAAALKRCGFSVKQSRTGDATKSLQARTNEANAWKADLFVSVHCNGGPDGATSRGIEVFHYPGSAAGAKAAKLVYDRLTAVSPWADRGVKTANFHVLRETKMPAILIEFGFINNTQEEAALNSPVYRLSLAEAACRGICEYFGIAYKAAQPTASKPAPKREFLEARIHCDKTDRKYYEDAAKRKSDFIVFYPTDQYSFKSWPKGV